MIIGNSTRSGHVASKMIEDVIKAVNPQEEIAEQLILAYFMEE